MKMMKTHRISCPMNYRWLPTPKQATDLRTIAIRLEAFITDYNKLAAPPSPKDDKLFEGILWDINKRLKERENDRSMMKRPTGFSYW